MLICTAVASTPAVLRLTRLEGQTGDLERRIVRAANEGCVRRSQSRRFLDGVSHAIEARFGSLQLTPAEADVAGLLPKGATRRRCQAPSSGAEHLPQVGPFKPFRVVGNFSWKTCS
jgi:hypothetical protein